jgi:hypothetical protein
MVTGSFLIPTILPPTSSQNRLRNARACALPSLESMSRLFEMATRVNTSIGDFSIGEAVRRILCECWSRIAAPAASDPGFFKDCASSNRTAAYLDANLGSAFAAFVNSVYVTTLTLSRSAFGSSMNASISFGKFPRSLSGHT